MIKYLPDAKEVFEKNETIEERKIIQEKIEYSVRGMEEQEAVEILRCAYKYHNKKLFAINMLCSYYVT